MTLRQGQKIRLAQMFVPVLLKMAPHEGEIVSAEIPVPQS